VSSYLSNMGLIELLGRDASIISSMNGCQRDNASRVHAEVGGLERTFWETII